MDRQDLINTCVFEQFQGLLFSDLSGPLKYTLQVDNNFLFEWVKADMEHESQKVGESDNNNNNNNNNYNNNYNNNGLYL